VLSTCNRTEVYVFAETFHGAFQNVRDFLSETAHVPPEDFSDALYAHYEADAVSHLFSVACGLDSAVLGENEIQGQVKSAWEAARLEGTCGSSLNALFRHAAEVGAARGRNLAGEDDETRRQQCLARDPARGVLLEDRVEDRFPRWNPPVVWMQGRAELVTDQDEVEAFYARRLEKAGRGRNHPPEDTLYIIRTEPEYVRAEGWIGQRAIIYRDFPE
jgi:hypothetical protein